MRGVDHLLMLAAAQVVFVNQVEGGLPQAAFLIRIDEKF
jgi:hypothetical protein